MCTCVCTSTCRAQQLLQGGPVTLCNPQHALDDAEEVVQETKTHLREKILCLELSLSVYVHSHGRLVVTK